MDSGADIGIAQARFDQLMPSAVNGCGDRQCPFPALGQSQVDVLGRPAQ